MTLAAGTPVPDFTVEVKAEPMKVFSLLTCDPNPIHWDVHAVTAAGLGDRVINQGGLNAAYLVNSVAAWLPPGARITGTQFRFLANAYAGDMLSGGGEVRSHENGTAELTVWLGRSKSDLVLQGTVTVSTATLPAPQR